jgi:PAS domain S-box-containing protein
MLYELNQAILAVQSPEVITRAALNHVRQLIPFHRASVVTFDHSRREATVLAALGPSQTRLGEGMQLPLDAFGRVEALQLGQVQLVDNLLNLSQPSSADQTLLDEGVRAYAIVPLIAQNDLIGTLNLGLDRPTSFDPEQVDIALEVASELAVAIQQARLLEQVRRYTTGLEQQVAEQTADLTQERDFISAVFDTVSALVIVLDRKGRIVRLNRACEQLTGYSFDELQGKLLWEKLILSDEVESVRASYEQLLTGEFPIRHDFYLIGKNDVHHLVSWTNAVLFEKMGSVKYIICTGIDITKRMQAEEALRESEELHRVILGNMSDAVFITTASGAFVYICPNVENIFGHSFAEVQASGHITSLLGDALVDHAELEIAGEIENIEHEIKDKSGQKHVLLINVKHTSIKGGTMLYTCRDITERKQTENEKVELLEAVSAQSQQLRALAARLAEAEEAERKQLARELHDQVGQKLTAVGLNLSIIREALSDRSPQSDKIKARADDSLTLVEEITDRIRDVMANLRPPVLDDYGLVAALDWYGARFSKWSDLTVSVQGDEPSPRLTTAIENALFRISQEALTNAARHAQANQILVRIEIDDGAVRLVIADDGIGFEPAGGPAEYAGRQSWGLLSMSERAEAVGGYCRVISRPKQGTQVIVEVSR